MDISLRSQTHFSLTSTPSSTSHRISTFFPKSLLKHCSIFLGPAQKQPKWQGHQHPWDTHNKWGNEGTRTSAPVSHPSEGHSLCFSEVSAKWSPDSHSNTLSFWFFLFPCLIYLGSSLLPPEITSQKTTYTQALVSDCNVARKLKPRQIPLLKAQDLSIAWIYEFRMIHSCCPKFSPGNIHTYQEESCNLVILKKWTNQFDGEGNGRVSDALIGSNYCFFIFFHWH